MKKLIQKIKDFWYNIHDQYRQYYHDKKMKKLFPKIIQEQDNDKESFFNEQNLRTLDNFMQVVQVIDIPEEYQLKGQQWQIMDKLNERSYFISKYLKEDLKLNDNVSNPEYYHIEDPSSNTPFSCRYLAIWKYIPVLTSKKTIYIINTFLSLSILSILFFGIYFII